MKNHSVTGQLPGRATKTLMHNPTAYLRMRVLGAIDMAEGNSIQARIRAVSQMTFTDEEGYATARNSRWQIENDPRFLVA